MKRLLKFIRSEKRLFVISSLIFFIFFGAGFVTSTLFPLKETHKTPLMDPFKGIYENPHLIQNPVYILRQNTLGFLTCFLGTITFGITTFSVLGYNGALLGLIVGNAWNSHISLSKILLLTLPHGIFEYPALWIAGTVGFKIPYETIRYFRGKKEHVIDKKEIYNLAIVFMETWILIVLAAIIESLFTTRFVFGGG